jgi:hypothetical protein
VYIVDVGKASKSLRHGRTESDLGYSMKYVWERITNTVLTGRKTAHIGVVGLKTNGTSLDALRFWAEQVKERTTCWATTTKTTPTCLSS